VTGREVRVVLVDDSVTVRAVLRRLLAADPSVRVVGEAADGIEAVEKVLALRPDIVVMDLELPGQDGLEATRQIRRRLAVPVAVVTSTVRRELVEGAFRAMDEGVVGVFPKPDVPEQWHELSAALRELACRVAAPAPRPGFPPPEVVPVTRERRVELVAIGASTGGPAALRTLLQAMGDCRGAALAVVQHIAEGFEEGLADWLARDTGFDVRVARDGDRLAPGTVRIAPPGGHLRVADGRRVVVDDVTPAVRGHRPSADVLFRSVADSGEPHAAGVLLTGMGSDGADGLLRMRLAGAFTVVQSESSCTVFGMPRAGLERGGAEVALSPEEIGAMLARLAREPVR